MPSRDCHKRNRSVRQSSWNAYFMYTLRGLVSQRCWLYLGFGFSITAANYLARMKNNANCVLNTYCMVYYDPIWSRYKMASGFRDLRPFAVGEIVAEVGRTTLFLWFSSTVPSSFRDPIFSCSRYSHMALLKSPRGHHIICEHTWGTGIITLIHWVTTKWGNSFNGVARSLLSVYYLCNLSQALPSFSTRLTLFSATFVAYNGIIF